MRYPYAKSIRKKLRKLVGLAYERELSGAKKGNPQEYQLKNKQPLRAEDWQAFETNIKPHLQ